MQLIKIALALGLAGTFAPVSAFFRLSCPGRVVRDRLDPIVNPGGLASHVHTISGGSAFGINMTYEDTQKAICSSCQIKEDKSNYWTPTLYVKKKDGTLVPVPVAGDPRDADGGMTVYYLQRGDKTLKAFPEGFRMLAGNPMKRNFTGGLDAQGINFACLGAGKAETNNIPNYNCPGGLRAQVYFPSCWNGKDLDSADHRSHMSYPDSQNYNNGPCPKDFPVHFISIFYELLYDVDGFKDEWNGDQHPFVFSNGDATGYGFHGDFVNGWDVDVLQKAVDTCNDDSGQVEKCGAVTMYTVDECHACKIPSIVHEDVAGPLKELPGCNAITSGPENAHAPKNCPVPEFGKPVPEYVDLTSSKKWEYVGCGTETAGSRAFKGKSKASDDMTVDRCVDFCSGAGFAYAGLEYGRECYCDDKLDPGNAPKQGIMGSCTMKCAGDAKQFCGNARTLSIYHRCEGSCANNPLKKRVSENRLHARHIS